MIENRILKTELIKWREIKPLQPDNLNILKNMKYEISNTGIIKRNEGKFLNGRYEVFKNEKVLKKSLANGYEVVTLFINGKRKREYVHRLLAIAFLENPENKKCINHKNGNRSDNSLGNLEWCSYLENNLHSINTLGRNVRSGIKNHFFGKIGINAKKVICTKTNKEYNSIKEASKIFGIKSTYLAKCLRGERPNKTTLIYGN